MFVTAKHTKFTQIYYAMTAGKPLIDGVRPPSVKVWWAGDAATVTEDQHLRRTGAAGIQLEMACTPMEQAAMRPGAPMVECRERA